MNYIFNSYSSVLSADAPTLSCATPSVSSESSPKLISVDSFAFDADTCLLLAFDKKWNATNNTADAYYYVLAFSSYDDNFAYEDIYVTVGVPEYSSASKTFVSDSMIHQQQIKKYIQQEH